MASASITVTEIARVYHSTMAMFFALLVFFFAYIVVRLITQGAWIYAGATLLLALSIAAIVMSQISKARNPVSQTAGVHLLAVILANLGVEVSNDMLNSSRRFGV